MPIFRIDKNKNFTVVSNIYLRDKTLSNKAKGLLTVLLSLSDDWDITQQFLVTQSSDGRKAISAQIGELIAHGYIVREQLRDQSNSHFGGVVYHVFESPQNVQNVQAQNVKSQDVKSENGAQINTNNNKYYKKEILFSPNSRKKCPQKPQALTGDIPSAPSYDLQLIFEHARNTVPQVRTIAEDKGEGDDEPP